MGRTTAFVVDGTRCLTSAEDPDHVLTTFTCDANGRLSTITDRRGGVTTVVYNSTSWKLSQIIEPQIAVDAGGGGTILVNPVINYSPWQTQTPATVSSISASVTDPAGRVTRFVPNRFGQATDITDPTGLHTLVTISGIRPTQITHSDGSVDAFMYDTRGRLTRSTPAGGSSTDYQYNSIGLLSATSGLGTRVDSLYYNTFNMDSLEVFTGTPRQTTFHSFDPSGTRRVTAATDNAGHTTTYTYDPKFGNLASTTIPGNRTTSKVFDAFGRDSVVTPPGVASQTTLYDVLNRVLSSSAAGTTMSYAYDSLFQTDIYDANSNHYHTDFNALGWPTNQCDALSACSTTRYDASGLTKSTTNRRGQLLSIARDGAGRVTSISGAGINSSNFSYSSNGLVMAAWNSVERDSIFVKPGSQTVAATDSVVTWIDGKRYRILHRTPRAIADLDSVSIISNTGTTFNDRIAYYSSSGFLSSFYIGPTGISFTPNADGTGGTNSIPGSGNRTNNVLAIHSTGSVYFDNLNINPTFMRSYHYDQAGRIDQVTQNAACASSPPCPSNIYSYDPIGRLSNQQAWTGCYYGNGADSLSGSIFTCSTLVSSNSYTYDAMGNRTDNGGVPTNGNRYVSLNGFTYTYDGDANLAMKWQSQANYRQYWWNATNQLDSARKNGWYREKYEYNAFGKPVRILYAEGDTPLAVTRYLLWDGDALLAELDPSGQRQVDYVYLPGAIDHPFAHTLGATTPTAVRYHEVDELGNVIGTIVSGTVSQNNSYDPWGNLSVSGNFDSQLFWKGLFWNDSTTGLYYVRNRWYDPEGGRFVNEDPAGFEGGINLYAFSGNDPVNGSDPSGLDAEICRQWYLTTHDPDDGWWELEGDVVPCSGGGSEPPEPPMPQIPGGAPEQPHGGGGGGPTNPSGPSKKPATDAGSCFNRERRANVQLVNGVLNSAVGSASTFFGKVIIGAAANRITNSSGSLAMIWGRSMFESNWGLWESLNPSPAVSGRILGVTLTGAPSLAVLAYNYVQGVAIVGAFKTGVQIGSAVVALDACNIGGMK